MIKDLGGQLDGAIAGQQEAAIPETVPLHRLPRAMSDQAIDLHDYPLGLPDEIDLEPLDPRAHGRPGEAVLAAEGQETLLELRPGWLGGAPCQREDRGAAAARVAIGDGGEGVHVEQASVVRLVDGALHGLGGKGVGEIQQRPGDRCHRDPVVAGHVVGGEPRGPVYANPAPGPDAGVRRHGHVDGRSATGPQPPKCSRAPVRQRRPGPARHGGRQPVGLLPQYALADRIDAAMDSMQASGSNPFTDAVWADAERSELSAGHEAILAACEGRQTPFDRRCVAFCTHLGA